MGVRWNPANRAYYASQRRSAQNVILQTQGASGSINRVSTTGGANYYVDANGHQTSSGGSSQSSSSGGRQPTGSAARQAHSLRNSLDQAVKQRDFGRDSTTGGRGITKKELGVALKNAGVTADTRIRGPLAQALKAYANDFATSGTAQLADKIANGDQAALQAVL